MNGEQWTMVTLAQYRQICAEWNGDPEEFSWLVEHGDIAGVSQRAIADEFEFASSTVCRWAAGEALPSQTHTETGDWKPGKKSPAA